MNEKLKTLSEKKQQRAAGGGPERIKAQHEKGKLTARERIQALLDPDSFFELNAMMAHRSTPFGLAEKKIPGDGVVTGRGTVNGRAVYVFAQDFTVLGGSLGEVHAAKICRVMDLAVQNGAPIIGLNDSGGARIQEGVDALKGYGDIFYRNTQASGVVPQITAILGPTAGGAVYSPALGDFILMARDTSYMFITGPQVVKTVLSEEVTPEELGGAQVHSEQSGIAHLVGRDDRETLDLVKELLGYLPSHCRERPPLRDTRDHPFRETPELYDLIPDQAQRAYDAGDLIRLLADDHRFLELQPQYARNIVVGFAHLDGQTIGVVANNPAALAGVLDINASDKAARFIRFCDAFHIPIATFVDTPGYMPGKDQEYNGIIRHGAKLLYAYAEATVPLMTVVVRKAYGGAYIAMASRHLGADTVLALPSAEIAVMGPKGACEIIFRKEISHASDPEKKIKSLTEEYKANFASPYRAAERGYVDDVVDPKDLRATLVKALRGNREKQADRLGRKHGVIPL